MRHFIRDDVTVPLRQHNVFFLVKRGLYKNKLQALALKVAGEIEGPVCGSEIVLFYFKNA